MFPLDTNIVAAAVRHSGGVVGQRIDQLTDDDLATSIVVAAELQFGLAKRSTRRLAWQLSEVLERLRVLPLTSAVEPVNARIRADLERRATPIGANDLFIAAHALSLGATLITDDIREFARVDGLAVENWMRD